MTKDQIFFFFLASAGIKSRTHHPYIAGVPRGTKISLFSLCPKEERPTEGNIQTQFPEREIRSAKNLGLGCSRKTKTNKTRWKELTFIFFSLPPPLLLISSGKKERERERKTVRVYVFFNYYFYMMYYIILL